MTQIYVGYLHGVLVNLNGLGIFKVELYHDGVVYGTLCHDGQNDVVRVSLETGLACWLAQSGESRLVNIEDDPRRLSASIQYALRLEVEPIVVQDEILTKLICAMLAHRVSGEQIIQGLKLDKINIQAKIVENYLGGWSVSQKSGDDSEIPSFSVTPLPLPQ